MPAVNSKSNTIKEKDGTLAALSILSTNCFRASDGAGGERYSRPQDAQGPPVDTIRRGEWRSFRPPEDTSSANASKEKVVQLI